MLIDFKTIPLGEAYGWIISTVTPRPIAWVATISPEGKTNLAPFSFFNAVSANPPTLMFVPVNHADGRKKDTIRNLEAVPEMTVNLVSAALAEHMNASSALLPYGESEFEHFGIAAAPSVRVKPPRVAAAPVAFECTLHSIVRMGEGPLAANVVFGLIQCAHIDPAILGADGRVVSSRLDTVGRLGGEDYSLTREIFSLRRPDRAPRP